MAYTLHTLETFDTWLEDLRDNNARIRILARLKRVEVGNLGDCKSVGSGVSELRLDYGQGYRLYYTQRGLVRIVLLCGGDKSSQVRDIARAQSLAADLPDLPTNQEETTP